MNAGLVDASATLVKLLSFPFNGFASIKLYGTAELRFYAFWDKIIEPSY